MRTVSVKLGRDHDFTAWERAHGRGEVPDAFPYGLDRLRQHGWGPQPGRHNGVPPKLRALGRRLGGGVDWLGAVGQRDDADVVLAWDERIGIPEAWGTSRPPVVMGVIWLTDQEVPRALRPALRRGLARAEHVYTLSTAQVPVLVDDWGLDRSRVSFVPFGVDTDFFRPAADRQTDPDLLVSVGNDRDRDFPTVFAAFERIRASRPAARLVVVSRTSAAQAGRDRPGVEVVPFLSHSELRSLVSRAAVSVNLTRPNLHVSGITAILESLALQVPVVASATAGMADYAQLGLATCPPHQDEAVAECVLGALAAPPDAAARRRMREHTVADFSTARQAQRLAALLDAATHG